MTSEVAVIGLRAIESILTLEPERVSKIWLFDKQSKLKRILQEAERHRIGVEIVNRDRLEKASEGGHHQGIVAWVRVKPSWDERQLYAQVEAWLAEDKSQKILLLALDNVQDPHNLGACLRSAEAFGARAVLIPRHQSAKITPAVCKVACGAAETMPIAVVANLSRALEALKALGLWVIGLAGEATGDLAQAALHRSSVLVLGSEGEGLRVQTKQQCDELVAIPLIGKMDSLNVSVAAGIALYVARLHQGRAQGG